MFIKIGNYIFNTNVIAYIKIVGAGCDVFLKDDTRQSVASVTEDEMKAAVEQLLGINC